LSGAQLGITVTNLVLGWISEPAIARLLQPVLEDVGIDASQARPVSLTLALVLVTGTTMIFGELEPKNLAIARPYQTARFISGFQRVWTTLNALPIRFFNDTPNAILREMVIQRLEELEAASNALDLATRGRHLAQSGTLPEDTAELVERSLEFGDRRARHAMKPRSQIVSLSPQDTLVDLIDVAKTSGYSRFPVLHTV